LNCLVLVFIVEELCVARETLALSHALQSFEATESLHEDGFVNATAFVLGSEELGCLGDLHRANVMSRVLLFQEPVVELQPGGVILDTVLL